MKKIFGKTVSWIWSILTLLTVSLFLSFTSQDAPINLQNRTKEELLTKWRELKPKWKGSPYSVEPDFIPPYEAGTLNPNALQDALNTLNFIRYMLGYPDDIELDQDYNIFSQHGSFLNAIHGYIAHNQTKPSEMSDTFYMKASGGISSSNLHYDFLTEEVYSECHRQIFSYMNDYDVQSLGHRAWIMNPYMKKTGFGHVEYNYKVFNSMFAVDSSRNGLVDYDYLAWPSQGYFPLQLISKNLVWSVKLDPSKFFLDSRNMHLFKIFIEKSSISGEKEEWTISPFTSREAGDLANDYLDFDKNGIKFNFAFRPSNPGHFKIGDRFKVKIIGIFTHQNQKAPIEYEFELFSLNEKITK